MFYLKLGPILRQYIIVIVASTTFFQVGVYLAWLSPLLVQLKGEKQNVLPEIITDFQGAWLASISALVGIITLFFTGYMADYIGRKYSMIIGYIPRLINCLMFLTATDVRMLLFGRAIGGISDVICCSVTSMYTSEIANKNIRGGLGTIGQIMTAIGSMLILGVGPFLNYMTLTTLISCITVVTFIPLLFLPESPYLLYSKGRVNEAKVILILIRTKDEIDEEIEEYSLNINTKVQVNKLQLLKDCGVLKTFLKVILLAIGSQTTGFNAIMYYLQSILESSQTSFSPEISSAIIGLIQVLVCCVVFAITDKFGRKPIFTISLLGITVGLLGLGTFFNLKDNGHEIVGFLNYLPLISLILVIGFNAGMGALIWTVCAELFDGQTRAIGVSLAVLVAFVISFLITQLFGSLSMAAWIYWAFAACCIVLFFFIIFFIPETKGKTFSEIQKDMGRDIKAYEHQMTKN